MKKANSHLADFQMTKRTAFISVLAICTGGFGGLTAIVLMKLIGFFTNLFFYHRFSFSFVADYPNHLGMWVILVPVVGGLIIGFMARYGSDKIRGHGIPEAMESILIGKSIISPKVALLKPISAAISIGSGGPFGAEGPIIMTGGSIGSVFGQLFHLTASERKILLLSGAAAGMSATFNSPLAAVIFVIELLAFEMRPRSIVPITIASGIADYIRCLFMGNSPMFPSHASPPLSAEHILIAVGFGVLGCGMAYALTRAIYGVEDLFGKLPIHWMWWPAIGAVSIGVGGYFVPQAMGVGYDSIHNLTLGQMAIGLALSVVIVKSIIWVIALGSGTSGGILAPLLIIGGTSGDLLCGLLHFHSPAEWSVLGMAAVFAGVTRSPFTTVTFILELTHDVHMMIFTLLASAIASGLSAIILPRSILTEKIARRDRHVARDYVVDPLELQRISQVMNTSIQTLRENMTISEAVHLLIDQKERYPYEYYPIISEDGKAVGIVGKSNLLEWVFQPEAKQIPLGKAFSIIVPTVHVNGTVKQAAEQMIEHNAERLLIIDDQMKPVGMLTRNSLLKARQNHIHDDTLMERPLSIGFRRRNPKIKAHTINK